MIEVVGGLIISEGRILLSQRRVDQDFPFAWESPGGKVNEHETHVDALRRELEEEIGIGVRSVNPSPLWIGEFKSEVYREERRYVRWSLYVVQSFAGEPSPKECQGLGWFRESEVRSLLLTPGNCAAIGAVVDFLNNPNWVKT